MDLSTRYLGLELPHPFMPGASPLVDSIDSVLRLEDAGAAALVLNSLFEEEIVQHGVAPERYIEHLLRIKQRTRLPVIASLNGTTAEGWLQYARMLERAGADALELNFYFVATDLFEDAGVVERRIIDISAVLKESLTIPVAVKLSPFFTALPHLARRLDQIGADGLVLFNRFYQPDIQPETLEVPLDLELSSPSELLVRLRWIAILYGRIRPSLALSGGVHSGRDAVKAVMAGADAVQIVSALIRSGPSRLASIREEFVRWAVDHRYGCIGDMRGRVSLARASNPAAFERGNYMRMLQAWHGGES
jgi:dihydroorotate dehydrogenase (fumarate)